MVDSNGGSLRFRRSSVVDQATEALRSAICGGELRDPLPGGYQLARILGVSRPSVRAALRRLAAEGVMVVRKGHRTRLIQRRKTRAAAAPLAVCVVSPIPLTAPFLPDHPVILEMHAQFASQGVRWDAVFEPKLGGKHPDTRLAQLIESRPNVGWILFCSPEPIQRWFASAGVPALVLGSCPVGLNLPSVDLDYRAVGWHAAGAMVRYGHRNLGLIVPAKLLPGDVACREGFARYLEQQANGAETIEFSAPESPALFRTRLAGLLHSPNRPTALLNMRPTLSLTMITEILGAGLKIPGDVSVIVRDSHPLIESALPEYTRYSSPSAQLATRAVRIATGLLLGHDVPTKPSLVTPTFVPGATLAACASSR